MLGVRRCLVEGNSKVVVHWGLRWSLGLWHLAHLILEMRNLIKILEISIFHVLREMNEVVDAFLPKRGTLLLIMFKAALMPSDV